MKFTHYLLIASVFALIGWFTNTAYNLLKNPSPGVGLKVFSKPLEKYTIENLSKTNFKPSELKIDGNLFSFDVEGKKVTGQINIPDAMPAARLPAGQGRQGTGPFPVIVMFRGYVDQKLYKTGDGTRRAAEVFAKNGYITIAPDFLGYGGSDAETTNIFESRFQTYVTALTLLSSLNHSTNQLFDRSTISIWGHSNGGQIALTVLEITGKKYPTVLWAPVSKPFPYSILYYTDESDDRGKLIRTELSKFEKDYDVEQFSLTNYLDRIKSPIQIHQGTLDDAVPVEWTDLLAKSLLALDLNLDYSKYPGADHNLSPSWSKAVQSSLNFFNSHLK